MSHSGVDQEPEPAACAHTHAHTQHGMFEAFAISATCGNAPELLSDHFHTFQPCFNSSVLPLSQSAGTVEGGQTFQKLRSAGAGGQRRRG